MTTAALVLVFWLVAAIVVAAAHEEPVTIATLLVTAFAYTRLAARESGITHALGAGVAWLVLSIAAEMTATAVLGHPWCALLGTPAHPLLRNINLFVWIFAPALFARGE